MDREEIYGEVTSELRPERRGQPCHLEEGCSSRRKGRCQVLGRRLVSLRNRRTAGLRQQGQGHVVELRLERAAGPDR